MSNNIYSVRIECKNMKALLNVKGSRLCSVLDSFGDGVKRIKKVRNYIAEKRKNTPINLLEA